MERISIVKIGGKVIENPQLLDSFIRAFSVPGQKKILVHGGGKMIDKVSEKLGLVPEMIDGRRITGTDTMEVVQMVLAGLLNKNLVSLLQRYHCNAFGLSGADGDLIHAVKRPVRDGIDYGWVGDVTAVNASLLQWMLGQDLVPVIASLTHDGNGHVLNTNADTIAAEISVSLSAAYRTDLVYCFDLPGVLTDIRKDESLIPEIRFPDYISLKSSGSVNQGMVPKLDNAFGSIKRGVDRVILMNASEIGNYLAGRKITGTILSS